MNGDPFDMATGPVPGDPEYPVEVELVARRSLLGPFVVGVLIGVCVLLGLILARLDDALDRPVRLVCDPTECEVGR